LDSNAGVVVDDYLSSSQAHRLSTIDQGGSEGLVVPLCVVVAVLLLL
jgi:hypothetical protein